MAEADLFKIAQYEALVHARRTEERRARLETSQELLALAQKHIECMIKYLLELETERGATPQTQELIALWEARKLILIKSPGNFALSQLQSWAGLMLDLEIAGINVK